MPIMTKVELLSALSVLRVAVKKRLLAINADIRSYRVSRGNRNLSCDQHHFDLVESRKATDRLLSKLYTRETHFDKTPITENELELLTSEYSNLKVPANTDT